MNQRPRKRNALALTARIRPERPLDECLKVEAGPRRLERVVRVDPVEASGELDIFAAGQLRVAERLVTDPPELGTYTVPRPAKSPMGQRPRRRAGERPEDREKGRLARAV